MNEPGHDPPSPEDTWSPPGPRLGSVPLAEVDAFNELPFDVLEHVAAIARVERLAPDEEVSAFGAALLLEGEAVVCATIVDAGRDAREGRDPRRVEGDARRDESRFASSRGRRARSSRCGSRA